jgi:hypothetical protein
MRQGINRAVADVELHPEYVERYTRRFIPSLVE